MEILETKPPGDVAVEVHNDMLPAMRERPYLKEIPIWGVPDSLIISISKLFITIPEKQYIIVSEIIVDTVKCIYVIFQVVAENETNYFFISSAKVLDTCCETGVGYAAISISVIICRYVQDNKLRHIAGDLKTPKVIFMKKSLCKT